MVAFVLSAVDLGAMPYERRRAPIVRIAPPEPLYPPRFLPYRRRTIPTR